MTKHRIKKITKFLPYDLHTVGVSKWMYLFAAHFSTCTELVTTIKGQASLLPCGCSLAATVTSRGFWPQLTRQTTSCSEWLVVRGCSFTLSQLYVIYLYIYPRFISSGVSSSGNTEFNDRVQYDLKTIVKETVVAKSKVLSCNFLGGVYENHKKCPVGIYRYRY
jgi:hypothetical protein